MGYGLSGGEGFIWISMPYIQKGKKENAVTWWGDRQATIDYCKVNLTRICEEFGGDMENLFICGFSRGAIAWSYIGLADDEIASFWKGLIAHDHFDGQKKWGYPQSDRASALERLARLKGRSVLVCGNANDYLKKHPELGNFTFLPVPVTKIFDIPDGLSAFLFSFLKCFDLAFWISPMQCGQKLAFQFNSNFSQSASAHKSISKHIKAYQNISKHIKAYQSSSKHINMKAQTCQPSLYHLLYHLISQSHTRGLPEGKVG